MENGRHADIVLLNIPVHTRLALVFTLPVSNYPKYIVNSVPGGITHDGSSFSS